MKTSDLFLALILVTAAACGDGSKGGAASTSAAASSTASGAAASGAAASTPASAKPEGPKKKSVTAGFCLGPDGTSQDCAISCKVDKDPDTCAKWAEKTKDICGKITKAQCQEICEKDENPTACELAKAMK